MVVMQWIVAHEKGVLRLFVVILVVVLAYVVWAHFHSPRTVTFECQEQAATATGVKQAADNAQVPLSSFQTKEVAQYIQSSVNIPPTNIVPTTGANLKQTIAQEQNKFKADFTIVTDPKNPSITINPATIPPYIPVTLNQYNIKAYPAHLIQIGGSYQEIMIAYSWKVNVPKIPIIAPNGDIGYLGVYSHANFNHPDMSRIGMMLTIPK
ncbi:MAG: hypothetical protein P4N59_18990 [Negativicutes bacterium]|nr:hypothetical protein [Negativicutes bacterium]